MEALKLTKTVKDRTFDDYFTEVDHSESIIEDRPGSMRLFYLNIRSGRIKRNYTNLLKPFGDMPREGKAEQLLSTLETFVLDAGMNSNKTARIMGVHANTIQYRLKKIHELLGVDITGNRVIPALTVALALHRMELETE